MLEAGIPPLHYILEKKKRIFLISRRDRTDKEEPFTFVFDLCRNHNTPGYRNLTKVLCNGQTSDPFDKIRDYVQRKAPTATKLNTYVTELNPSLNVHDIYLTSKYVPEYHRESFTLIRLMSHNLRVETGRWHRTPTLSRTCSCDNVSIQTENHVLISCALSESCRHRYPMLNFNSMRALLSENEFLAELCK